MDRSNNISSKYLHLFNELEKIEAMSESLTLQERIALRKFADKITKVPESVRKYI